MAEQWLSIVEYARAFAMSDMTVRRRIKNGKIKAVLKDGKYYIPVAPEKAAVTQPREHIQRPIVHPKVPTHTSESFERRHEPAVTQPVSRPEVMSYTPSTAPSHNAASFVMPEGVSKHLLAQEQSLIHTQQLLNYCSNSLKKFEQLERVANEKGVARTQALEATLAKKDAEIAQLRQQIEDLQLLVRIFEKKTAGY